MAQQPAYEVPADRGRQWTWRYGIAVTRHPFLFVLIPFLICFITSVGLLELKSTPDTRIFFSENNPQLQALEDMESTFSKSDNALIAFQPIKGSIFTPEIFQLVLELTEASWQVPYSNRVTSLSNFQYVSAAGDVIVVRDLIDTDEAFSTEFVDSIEQFVMNKPSLVDSFVSVDGTVSAVNITVQKPVDDPQAVFEIIAYVRGMVRDFEARYPNVRFFLTGATAFDAAFTEIPAEDNRLLGPLMIMIILVILAVSLRSLWFVVTAVLLIGLAVGAMLGITGWLGARMNAGTTGAPVIVLSLSVAYCVHVLVTIRQQLLAGVSKAEAIAESLRINVIPVAITGMTTAVGFLSLNFSDAPPFRQLGNMVAFGVVVTFILSVTFLPGCLCLVKLKVRQSHSPMSVVMRRLAELVISFHRSLLVFMGIIIVVMSLGSLRIVLDDNFVQYFDSRYRLRTDTDFIEQNLTGMNALEYPLYSGSSGGVMDPDYLQTLQRFEQWLRAQEKVTSTVSVVEVIKDLNRSLNDNDPAYHKLPESRALAAQLMLMYELSLPSGGDLTHQVDIDKATSRVVALMRNASSAELRSLNKKAEEWLQDNTDLEAAKGTGLSLIFAYISERNINSMLFGSLFALFVISLILIFALRSLSMGLLSLAPNLVPAAMALGAWGYLVGTAGLSVAIVVAITLGIVVDDTVHFLSKYLRARRELFYKPEAAVEYAFRTVGVALWITSLTLMAGFLVLALSGFRVTAEMGLLSAVTIGLALVTDFLFLPPLLLKIDKDAD